MKNTNIYAKTTINFKENAWVALTRIYLADKLVGIVEGYEALTGKERNFIFRALNVLNSPKTKLLSVTKQQSHETVRYGTVLTQSGGELEIMLLDEMFGEVYYQGKISIHRQTTGGNGEKLGRVSNRMVVTNQLGSPTLHPKMDIEALEMVLQCIEF